MSGQGSVTFAWADDDHTFCLAKIGLLRELQTKLDAAPIEVLDRLMGRSWRVDDVREVIRLGLIGGGMKPERALAMVKTYVDDLPLYPQVAPAKTILMAALVGVPDEPVGKTPAARDQTGAADASPLPPSTVPAPPSA